MEITPEKMRSRSPGEDPERSETARSAGERSGGASPGDGHLAGDDKRVPDPEVTPGKSRRIWTAAAKLRVLDAADRCKPGEIGALLRREGLYSSALATWRKARESGILGSLTPALRGPKPAPITPKDLEIKKLRRENAQLKQRLSQAETLIDIQKKLSSMLGIPLKTDEDSGLD